MKKRFLFIFIVLAGSISAATILSDKPTPQSQPEQIHWTDFETAVANNKKDKKPFFIDMYTDWCSWCKKMDVSTFQDPEVIAFINDNFHAVKFNPEDEEAVAYKGRLYEKKVYPKFRNKAYNELAVNLMENDMSFPTFVILSKKEIKMGTIPGYQKPRMLISRAKDLAKIK